MTQALQDEAITAWLRHNATPLNSTVAGDSHDLEPLKKSVQSAKIVGLAESTHGTKEFFQIRHRLLRMLVVEMGFNALAIEASSSAARAVNEYIVDGRGDRATVLTGLGFVMWDVVEFAEVVDWLHEYNEGVDAANKVHFYGVDIWNTRPAREQVLEYLSVVAPEKVPLIQALFRTIAAAEVRGMMLAHEHVEKSGYLDLRSLADDLAAHRDDFIQKTSAEEFEWVTRDIRVILQWMQASLTDELADEWPLFLPRMSTMNNYARSKSMAENLLQILEDRPDMKVVLWAHVFHLGFGFEYADRGTVPTMGEYLRERFADQYYVFGLELSDGEYLARTWLADDTLGDLTVGRIPPAPQGSLSSRLSKLGARCLTLDLRTPAEDPLVEQWLSSPQILHAISWAHRDPLALYTSRVVTKAYDGIIYIAHTSATTPTENALAVVSARIAY